ncbi:hypothetical protein Glove_323g17 [Diversispora epigaea]|uniref:Cytochrome P450 n=1 Tax=Diversispora epigaea TaxID=1348612 RepID=A0A397HTU6_9GLOM|nr:hypothetical protein Glove_323g17 [Diversispora epigaea]
MMITTNILNFVISNFNTLKFHNNINIIFIIFFIFFASVIKHYHKLLKRSYHENHYSKTFIITDIHNAKKILQETDVISRAIPNQRLKNAFGISNPFTNPDENYRIEFRNAINKTINIKNEKWKEFVKITLDTINKKKFDRPTSIELIPWIQKITLNVVLRGYLGFHPNIHEIIEIENIPEIINKIWIDSKEFENNKKSIKKSNNLLKNILQKAYSLTMTTTSSSIDNNKEKNNNVLHILSEIGHKHLQNTTFQSSQPIPGFTKPTVKELKSPLNIILPAYETMWRVLLYAILEIKVRKILHQKSQEKLKKQEKSEISIDNLDDSVENFLNNPSYTTLKNNPLHLIVKETLRLYPATRHIHRIIDDNKYTIDLETIHRDPKSWKNPLLFNPERFKNHVSKDHPFIPFSMGKMKCIAADKFAPTLAAILIASVISSIEIMDIIDDKDDNDEGIIDYYQKNPDLPFKNDRKVFEKTLFTVISRS